MRILVSRKRYMVPLILVVDDEPVIREVLAAVLADEGYRVACAADGQDALDMLDVTAPDVLLTDVSMPRMTGVQLIRTLRDRGDTLPIVLMSTRYPGADITGVRFVAKPFDLDEVTTAVRGALAGLAPRP